MPTESGSRATRIGSQPISLRGSRLQFEVVKLNLVHVSRLFSVPAFRFTAPSHRLTNYRRTSERAGQMEKKYTQIFQQRRPNKRVLFVWFRMYSNRRVYCSCSSSSPALRLSRSLRCHIASVLHSERSEIIACENGRHRSDARPSRTNGAERVEGHK